MIIQPQNAERLVRLLVWIGGVVATAIGAWVTSKIRVYQDHKNAHHEELKKKVLEPLRSGLKQHFGPLVSNLAAVLHVDHAAREFNPKAKVTQDPIEEGPVLAAAFPSAKVFGPVDDVLLEDARKNHHRETIAQVDKLVSSWGVHAGEYHRWAMRVANEILTTSGLPAFPNRERVLRPYVMQFQLAIFVYKRLVQQPTRAIEIGGPDAYELRIMTAGDSSAAVGTDAQLKTLAELLDKLIAREEPQVRKFRETAAGLHESYNKVIHSLDFAIASRRLRKRCDLVPFF
jgi:hypothetical protein